MKDNPSFFTDEILNQLNDADQEKWESGNYYGEDPQPMSGEMLDAWNAAKSSLAPTSIYLTHELIQDLKACANQEGLGFHSLIRIILTRAVQEWKKAS